MRQPSTSSSSSACWLHSSVLFLLVTVIAVRFSTETSQWYLLWSTLSPGQLVILKVAGTKGLGDPSRGGKMVNKLPRLWLLNVSASYWRVASRWRDSILHASVCNHRRYPFFLFWHVCHSYMLQVALVPGDAFGNGNCIRISYAASMEELTSAMEGIESAMKLLKPVSPASLAKWLNLVLYTGITVLWPWIYCTRWKEVSLHSK